VLENWNVLACEFPKIVKQVTKSSKNFILSRFYLASFQDFQQLCLLADLALFRKTNVIFLISLVGWLHFYRELTEK
jgi:hypothetical protein